MLLLFIIVAIIGTIFWLHRSKHSYQICDQPYALCTSARCLPDPKDEKRTICFCTAQEGKSLGKTECQTRKPYQDKIGLTRLFSTFSMEEFPEKNVLQCPANASWSNCLDSPCVVDPTDPTKAICSCERKKGKPFVTLGGKCNPSSCEKMLWSGALLQDNEDFISQIEEEENLKIIPKKCPSTPQE